MNKIQLYIDEDASRSSFINALRLNNIDCVTTAEANNLGNDDQRAVFFGGLKAIVF